VFGAVLWLMLTLGVARPGLARIHRASDWVRLDGRVLEYRRWPLPPERVRFEDIVEVEVGPASWRHQVALGRRLRVEHRHGVADLGAERDLENWHGLLTALVAVCDLGGPEAGAGGTARYSRRSHGSPGAA
jgi:hypothetical protein